MKRREDLDIDNAIDRAYRKIVDTERSAFERRWHAVLEFLGDLTVAVFTVLGLLVVVHYARMLF